MLTQFDTEPLFYDKMIFFLSPGFFCYQLHPGKITHLCQKFCMVVYPAVEESPEPNGPQHKDKEDGKSSQTAD